MLTLILHVVLPNIELRNPVFPMNKKLNGKVILN